MENRHLQIHKYHQTLKNIAQELETLPKGRLKIRQKYLSHVIDGKEVGITQNKVLIRQLLRQRFLHELQERINYNLHPKTLVVNLKNTHPKAVISALPKSYQTLPIHYFYHSTIPEWQSRKVKKNPYKPDQLTYTSKGGTPLRSKSKKIIADLLEENLVPYHYEPAMNLDGKIVYPDFVIKAPFTGKAILWEHFGALHEEHYIEKMNEKMQRYMDHGYTPGENLIVTFEFDVMAGNRLNQILESYILNV